MKTCSKCNLEKPCSEFRFRETRGSWHSICRSCESVYQRQRGSTPAGRANRMWRGMIARANNSDGDHPTYADVELRMSRDEFISWAIPVLEEWYLKNPDVVPTVDRIENSGHYELGNLRFISGTENTHFRGTNRNVHGPEGHAWCSLCKRYLPSEHFSKDASSQHGLQNKCKDCTSQKYTQGKYRQISDEETSLILSRYLAGESGYRIAKDCGRSMVFVYRVLRRSRDKGLIS